MSFGGDSATYEIIVDLSQVAQLGDVMASSAAKGAAGVKKSISGLDHAVALASKGVTGQAQKLGANIAKGTAQGIKSNSALVQAALVQQATQASRAQAQASQAAARSSLAAQNAAARLQIAQAKAAGQATAVAAQTSGQLAVTAARTSGQQRVAITRFTLDSIARLEKGLGRVIEGTASTIVSATRRVFAGTVGSLQRSFAERRSIITRNLNVERGLFANSAAIQQRTSRGLLGASLGAAGLLGGGALVIGAIRQTFTLGSQFATGLNVLQAQLHLTADEMKVVSDLSIKLGNDVKLPGVSALDAAQAIGLLGKQFASAGDQAIVFAEQAAKGTLQLSRATGATAEQAAAAIGSAVNAFGVSAQDAGRVADSFAGAVARAGGADFGNFTDALSQGAAVFSQFQVPAVGAIQAVNEFNAAIATLSKGGLAGGDAGAALKQFFLQANRSAPAAANALDAVAKKAGVLGGVFFDQNQNARDLTSIINILNAGLTGLSDAERTATLQTIFGSRGIAAANILLKEGGAGFLTSVAALNQEGRAAELAAAKNKGLAGAIDAIKSQFETFAILIFQKINLPVGRAGLAVADFIDKLANAGGIFAAVRAGLKGVGIALGGLIAIKGLGEIIGFARALVGFLGPLGIAAIVLGAAVGFLAKRFGGLQGTLDAIGRLIDRLSPKVAALRKVVFDFLSNLAGRATVLGRFSGFLQQIFNLLGQGKAAQAFDRLKVAAGALLENLKPLGDAFKLLIIPLRNFLQGNFVEAFRGLEHVGSEIAQLLGKGISAGLKAINPFVGVGLDFISKFKAQFIGGGIGAVAGGLLGGPLGVVIGAGIGVAVTNGILKLKDIIGRINVGDLFGKFLDGVKLVGQKLAQVLFDKKTLLAVAGVAGAAAAIAVQFVSGFVSGLISKLGDIRAAGARILQAIFDLPSIAKSIAAFVILFRGILTDQFKRLKFDDVLSQQINQGVQKAAAATNTASLGQKLTALFQTVGKKAGQGLSIGIAAALSGSALGSASSGLDKALGIGSLLGSVAAGGAAFGPAGAIGAAGIGLVTTALSSNAKKAAEAKKGMDDFRTAMVNTGGVAPGVAAQIETLFGGTGVDTLTKKLLTLTSFTTQGFTKALQQGRGEAFIKDINTQLLEAGVNVSLISHVTGTLTGQLKQSAAAAKDLALSQQLTASGGGLQSIIGFTRNLLTATLETAAARRRLGEKIATERAKASVDVLKGGMDDLKTAAVNARQAVIDALNPPAAKTPQQAVAGTVTNLPSAAAGVGEAVQTGLTTVLGGAQLSTAIDGFKEQLKGAVSDGVGNIFDPATVENNLAIIRLGIQQLNVGDDIKAQLTAGLDAFQAENLKVAVPLDVTADLISAAAAGDQAAAAALAALGRTGPISIKSKADAVAAGITGTEIFNSADSIATRQAIAVKSKADAAAATAAGSTIHSTAAKAADKQITVGNKVTATPGAGESAGRSIATNVGTGFKNGLSGMFASIQKTVTTIVNGAVISTAQATLRISSPSKVFHEIGENTMQGLVLGIREGGKAAEDAVGAVVSNMIDATKSLGSGLRAGFDSLFKETFDQLAIGGGGNTGTAIAGFTTSLRSVISQVASNAQSLFDAASKDPNQRTLAERLLLGESFTSLRLGDEFGVANRSAIASAVDAIKSIGDALLEQGFAAQDAANMLSAYRDQLIATAVQAGLSQTEVQALVDSLGLSSAGLAQFVTNANRLSQIVASGGNQPPPPPLPVGPNPTQQFITNNLYLPTGDPEANALAVVNRLALAVR